MIRDDQQFLVDIEMPDDIDVALDNDGLPKVVPKEQAKKEVKAETATKVAAPDTSEVDQLRRELAAERSARETAAAEAAAAKAAAEDERRARTGVERSLEERTVQAMQSHWAKVNADAKAIDELFALVGVDLHKRERCAVLRRQRRKHLIHRGARFAPVGVKVQCNRFLALQFLELS